MLLEVLAMFNMRMNVCLLVELIMGSVDKALFTV